MPQLYLSFIVLQFIPNFSVDTGCIVVHNMEIKCNNTSYFKKPYNLSWVVLAPAGYVYQMVGYLYKYMIYIKYIYKHIYTLYISLTYTTLTYIQQYLYLHISITYIVQCYI